MTPTFGLGFSLWSRAILKQNSITVQVDPDSRLVDVGLTSMDMVNLMLGVEAEFDFTIPQSEITPENFQSIKTLELMIVQSASGSRRFPDLKRTWRRSAVTQIHELRRLALVAIAAAAVRFSTPSLA